MREIQNRLELQMARLEVVHQTRLKQNHGVIKMAANACFHCFIVDRQVIFLHIVKNAKCHNCENMGHIKKICHGKQSTGVRLWKQPDKVNNK